jgi:hypothetical protein
MLEAYLFKAAGGVAAADNSDIAFPAGTPFKGVTRAADLIDGPGLATLLGVTTGTPMNNDAGWLHFIEADGMELYIAKKPLRYNVGWEQLQIQAVGKTVTIGGVDYICRLLTGATADPAPDTNARGGEWDRYLYGVYNGDRRAELPAGTPVWGNYTAAMLGIGLVDNDDSNGVMSLCKESYQTIGHIARGVKWNRTDIPNIMGMWYQLNNTPQPYHGWRPVLVKASTIPAIPYKGLVAAADFITGSALATLVGFSQGTLQNDTVPWMKFVVGTRTRYIPQRPIRFSVTWEALNALNLVLGKTVTFGGKSYIVRLLTGCNADPASTADSFRGGEWTELMTPVNNGVWASFTTADLGAGSGSPSGGNLNLLKETYSGGGHMTRGYHGFNDLWYQIPNTTHDGYSWRPVLEEVLHPGPQALQAGDTVNGFYGEVPAAEFFTGSQLATAVGAGSTGTLINDTTPWLKLSKDGKVIYIPQKAIRIGLSWNVLDGLGIRTAAQNTIVAKDGHTYRVRLMSGTGTNWNSNRGEDPANCADSDYNRFIYRLCALTAPSETGPVLGSYSLADLGMRLADQGCCFICSEGGGGVYVQRNGGGETTYSGASWNSLQDSVATNLTDQYRGWRPVLELVS